MQDESLNFALPELYPSELCPSGTLPFTKFKGSELCPSHDNFLQQNLRFNHSCPRHRPPPKLANYKIFQSKKSYHKVCSIYWYQLNLYVLVFSVKISKVWNMYPDTDVVYKWQHLNYIMCCMLTNWCFTKIFLTFKWYMSCIWILKIFCFITYTNKKICKTFCHAKGKVPIP